MNLTIQGLMVMKTEWKKDGTLFFFFYKYHIGHNKERQYSLPPDYLGWPFLGKMWSFLQAFKSNNPDSFISNFVSRSLFHPFSLSLKF
ncbi:hypothetical protein CIPAW_13G020100 [Carya illinoinensis]|uniref:Uncharacterized protein n=1 Tax=Carya illinoinensis TaxID=32201 RepID=A0A8T1NLA1_CARIL|nr:hypothetical protein CIPAW_13G020100 [Carya illinoinensis]